MQYKTPLAGIREATNEEKIAYLNAFRTEIEDLAQSLVDIFGVDKETDDVVRHLKGARQDSGILFPRMGVEDLNRTRDAKARIRNPKKK